MADAVATNTGNPTLTDNMEYSWDDKRADLERQIHERFGDSSHLSDVYDTELVYCTHGKHFRLGFTEDGMGHCMLDNDTPAEVRRVVQYEPIAPMLPGMGGVPQGLPGTPTPPSGGLSAPAMSPGPAAPPAPPMNSRQEVIDYLTANCECWKSRGAQAALNTLSDAELANLQQRTVQEEHTATVANAALTGFTDPTTGDSYRMNPETWTWEKMAANEDTEESAGSDAEDEDEGETDDAESDEDEDTDQEGTDDDEDGTEEQDITGNEGEGVTDMGKTTEVVTANQGQSPAPVPAKQLTFNEWIAQAPPEAQTIWNNAVESLNRERVALVDRLTANLASDEAKASAKAIYAEMDLSKLRTLASTLPDNHGSAGAGAQGGFLMPRYDGASTPITGNRRKVEFDESDILPMPVMAWGSEEPVAAAK